MIRGKIVPKGTKIRRPGDGPAYRDFYEKLSRCVPAVLLSAAVMICTNGKLQCRHPGPFLLNRNGIKTYSKNKTGTGVYFPG